MSSAAPASIGFACHWDPVPEPTWSGTPWKLRTALRSRADVRDLDVAVPPRLRQALRAGYARRHDGHWMSMWKHSLVARELIERRLRAQAAALDPDVVLEIQDLGMLDRPYFVVQDLSYDLLLDKFGSGGVPHFRQLSERQITRQRDRQRQAYAGAAGLLPMSRWLAASQIANGADPDRVRVVNPGVNVPLAADAPLVERRTSDVSRLLFVGRDFDTKAGDQVLAAFALLRADLGEQITLTVAGPRTWPLASAIPTGVDFRGLVPPAEVQALYDSHDLFVMPSRFEGFGIAFVEALVRGLPCIGRNSCAMPEIIEPGSGGLLVEREDPAELAETVLAALADDELYRRCAAEAPRRRAHFTWDRAAAEIVSAVGASS